MQLLAADSLSFFLSLSRNRVDSAEGERRLKRSAEGEAKVLIVVYFIVFSYLATLGGLINMGTCIFFT